jgi:hypothetical protein
MNSIHCYWRDACLAASSSMKRAAALQGDALCVANQRKASDSPTNVSVSWQPAGKRIIEDAR